MAGLQSVSDSDFDREVLQSPLPVLVDFWGDGCVPCQQMKPVVEALATEFAGRAKVVTCNVVEHFEVGRKYNVTGVPMFAFFKNGQVVAELRGLTPKKALAERLAAVAAS